MTEVVGALFAALTVTGAAPRTIDLGAQSIGGYAVFDVVSRVGEPLLTLEYANHPEGLSGKGDFQRETSARYLGKDFDLPVLPGNVNRHEIYRIGRTGRFVAPLIQGQERYVRFHVEPADASIILSDFTVTNAEVFAAEPLAGSFHCSDERFDRLWSASVWTCRLASFPNHDAWKNVGGRLLPRKLEKGCADGWCLTLAPMDGVLEVVYEFDANPHFPVGCFAILAGGRRTDIVQDGTNVIRTVSVPVKRGERFGLSVEKESWPVIDSVMLKASDGTVLFQDDFEGSLDRWEFSRTRSYVADGAKRDRLVWSGDLWWAERNFFHAFAPSIPYVRESILMLAANQTPEGYVMACPYPENRRPPAAGELGPWQSDEFAAWLIPVAWDYLLYTGDDKTLRTVYPAIRKLMSYLMASREDDGLFKMRPDRSKSLAGSTLGNTGHTLYMNLLLWKCYRDAAAIADELGESDGEAWRAEGAALAKEIRRQFWNAQTRSFDLSLEDRRFRIWPNAFALACGFATADEAHALVARLTRVGVGKMLALVLRGKFEYGYGNSAIATFEGSNWFKVIDDSWPGAHCTTECMYMMTGQWWDESHPDTAMAGQISDYILGVRPTAPGYRTWMFDPHPGPLTFAEGKVPTPRGAIEVRWDRVGDKLRCRIREPGKEERRFELALPPEPEMSIPAAAEEGKMEFLECASDTTVNSNASAVLELDLGKIVNVRQLRLVPESHGYGWPKNLKVEMAERSGLWRTVSERDALPLQETDVSAQTVVGLTSARYLRLSATKLGPAWVEGNYNLQFGKVEVDFE